MVAKERMKLREKMRDRPGQEDATSLLDLSEIDSYCPRRARDPVVRAVQLRHTIDKEGICLRLFGEGDMHPMIDWRTTPDRAGYAEIEGHF